MLARVHLDYARRRELMRKLRKMLNHPPCEIMVTIPGKITDRPPPSISSLPSYPADSSSFTRETPTACIGITAGSCSDLGQLYDRSNRVESLTRLAQLQARDGRWDYSPELADLVRRWRRGHSEELGATMAGDEVTLIVALVMSDLCHAVWMFGAGGDAQAQKGPAAIGLKPSEQAALRSANREWILGALDRANASASEQEDDDDVQLGRLIVA